MIHSSKNGLGKQTLLQGYASMLASRRAEDSVHIALDLDRFKEVNDTLGHQVGDALLIDVA